MPRRSGRSPLEYTIYVPSPASWRVYLATCREVEQQNKESVASKQSIKQQMAKKPILRETPFQELAIILAARTEIAMVEFEGKLRIDMYTYIHM